MNKSILILLCLFFVGCAAQPTTQKVYEITCWSGGTVIYHETIVRSSAWMSNKWETLDGQEAVIPWGQLACMNKLIGVQQRKENHGK